MENYENKLKKYILDHKIEAQQLVFMDSCHSVKEAAATANANEDDFVKNICMLDKEGNVLVAIVKGEDKVSTAKIGDTLGIGKPEIASPEQILHKTGYPCGGLPSFGYKARFLIDTRVMEKTEIYTGGGSTKSLVKISTEELLRASQGLILDIRK